MTSQQPERAEGENLFLTILRGSIQHLPGARISREEFLRRTLFPYCSADAIERAIESSPAKAGISRFTIEKLAKSSIAWHRTGVSSASAVLGLPGLVFAPATIPSDVLQFYWHVIVITQKLAYLYGWPVLIDKETEFDDETLHRLVIFIGVMFGLETAIDVLKQVAARVAVQVVKRLPQEALTKVGLYVVAKEAATWIGIQLTKNSFAQVVAKGIPLISGLISGSMTWVVFSVMAKRLRTHLAELPLANE
jgi:uncharacterized membrane protein